MQKNRFLFRPVSFLLALLLMTTVFSFGQDLQPTPTEACLTVKVFDGKKKPQTGEKVIFENSASKKEFSGVTKENGSFKILLPKNATYKIKYKNFSTNVDYSTLTLPLSKDTLVNFAVNLTFDTPETFTLGDVNFDAGKASIRPESFKELNQLAEYMNNKKDLVIEIAGHTDNVGTKESNQKLSEDRSKMVVDYLVKKGIAQSRLKAIGYGDSRPVASNDTDAGKQKNRRTEIRVISK